MNIQNFSKNYSIRQLSKSDAIVIYELCQKNSLYYSFCPPFVTLQHIEEDMHTLPSGKTLKDKYYIGYFDNEKLIAVMDFIDGYPGEGIGYIGFFMTDVSIQGQGIGTSMITDLCNYLSALQFKALQLAYVKGNPQAEHFWLKNGFSPLRETISNNGHTVISAERIL